MSPGIKVNPANHFHTHKTTGLSHLQGSASSRKNSKKLESICRSLPLLHHNNIKMFSWYCNGKIPTRNKHHNNINNIKDSEACSEKKTNNQNHRPCTSGWKHLFVGGNSNRNIIEKWQENMALLLSYGDVIFRNLKSKLFR